jgi:hypothetical protein
MLLCVLIGLVLKRLKKVNTAATLVTWPIRKMASLTKPVQVHQPQAIGACMEALNRTIK